MNQKNKQLLEKAIQEKIKSIMECTDFEEGKKLTQELTKLAAISSLNDKNSIESKRLKNNIDIEKEKNKIDADKISIEKEKNKIEVDKNNIEKEKNLIDSEKNRKDHILKGIELGLVVLVPVIEVMCRKSYAKQICNFEKEDCFTTSAGRGLSSLFRFK